MTKLKIGEIQLEIDGDMNISISEDGKSISLKSSDRDVDDIVEKIVKRLIPIYNYPWYVTVPAYQPYIQPYFPTGTTTTTTTTTVNPNDPYTWWTTGNISTYTLNNDASESSFLFEPGSYHLTC